MKLLHLLGEVEERGRRRRLPVGRAALSVMPCKSQSPTATPTAPSPASRGWRGIAYSVPRSPHEWPSEGGQVSETALDCLHCLALSSCVRTLRTNGSKALTALPGNVAASSALCRFPHQ
jgi:hypothetical protein